MHIDQQKLPLFSLLFQNLFFCQFVFGADSPLSPPRVFTWAASGICSNTLLSRWNLAELLARHSGVGSQDAAASTVKMADLDDQETARKLLPP